MEFRERIYEIVSGVLNVPVAELSPTAEFRSLPNTDSMRVLQIILETENEFDIEIDGDATFRIETIGEFQELVEGLCRQTALA